MFGIMELVLYLAAFVLIVILYYYLSTMKTTQVFNIYYGEDAINKDTKIKIDQK